MAHIDTVGVVDGIPTSGTGDVYTIDKLVAALPTALAANGGLKVEGVASGVVIPVADGGGSLTVDNGGTFAVQATVAASATNIAKAEDVASASGDVGVPAMAVQVASASDLAGTTGDYAMLQMSGGRLLVDTTGTVSIGEQPISVLITNTSVKAEDDPSANGDTGTPVMAIQKATPVDTAGTDGDYVMLQMSGGRLWASTTIDNALPVGTNVIGGVTVAAGAANIAKAEDAASANADVGVPAMAIQKASPADTAGTDGDYAMLQMSAGRLWVDPSGVTLTVGSHAVTNAGTFAVQGTAKGTTAADAALSDAPVTLGGRATNTNLAEMSADGDVVNAQMTMQGALVTAHAPRELLAIQQTQLSNTTSETTIVSAGASGIFNDLYGIILANTGASTTKVTIKDATSGTTRAIIEVPTLETRGFMLPAASAVPQASAANNWTATCGTATTALEVTAMYVKRK